MDIKTLYTMLAVAEGGSFAAAAKSLDVSLSTVSLQISALEKDLGKLFFDRSSRPATLTAAGHSFTQGAKDIVKQWEQLQGKSVSGHLQGALKIGAVHTVVSHSLPPALFALQQKAPDLTVRLATGLTSELIDKVSRNNLDCAIITVPEYIPPDVSCFEITQEPLVVMAHKSAHGKSARSILENNPYVKFSPEAEVARIAERMLLELRIKVNSRMEIDTLDAVISLIKHGLGVSVVPCNIDDRELPDNVKIVNFKKPQIVRTIGLVIPKDSRKTDVLELLIDVLRNEYRRAV